MMKANGENAELWDAHELEWFCMTCWNLTLKHMNDWGPFKVSYLAQVTTKVFLSKSLIFVQPPDRLLNGTVHETNC